MLHGISRLMNTSRLSTRFCRLGSQLIVFPLVVISLCSCGRTSNSTDVKITTTLKPAAISAIEAHDGIIVRYEVDKKIKVETTMPAKFKDDIIVESVGNRLVARLREGSNISNPNTIVRASGPALTRVTVTNAAQVTITKENYVHPSDFVATVETAGSLRADDMIQAQRVRVKAKTAGLIQLKDVFVDDFTAEAVDVGIISVEGKCLTSNIRTSSGGDIRIPQMEGRASSETHEKLKKKRLDAEKKMKKEAAKEANLQKKELKENRTEEQKDK